MAGEFPIELELNKLGIGTILKDQSYSPVVFNPFYDGAIKEEEEGASNQSEMIFNPLGRASIYDVRRGSVNEQSDFSPIRTIRNCNFKKTATASSNCLSKVVLREPILKAFQRCLHPQNIIRKRRQSESVYQADIKANEESVADSNCRTIEALNLDSSREKIPEIIEGTKLTPNDRNQSNVTDFRQLLEECQTLLQTNVSFITDLSSNHSRKNSKTFNTIQLPSSRSSNEAVDTNLRESSSAENTASKFRGEQIARPAGLNTTCSQQARITTNGGTEPMQQPATTPSSCDVTIDELASYFETLVHIPKKMSTMAEMMYI